MPSHLLERVRGTLDSVYPPFLAVALEVLAECEADGAPYFLTRGFSTYAEQTALWRQGRAAKGPVVTNALGGQSAHNFGLAFDGARDTLPDVPKLQPGWRREDYAALGKACAKRGLVWGGTFKSFDGPHFQWPGYVTGVACRALDSAMTRGKLPAVWALLEKERATPEWQRANPLLAAELKRLGF